MRLGIFMFAVPFVAALAQQPSPLLARVASFEGQWFDESANRPVSKNYEIRSGCRLVRKANPQDADWLEVNPTKPDEKPVKFRCSEGVTCNGPLNLGRIPKELAYLEWLFKEFQETFNKLERYKNLIHRGSSQGGLVEGVVQLENGMVSADQLYAFSGSTNAIWIDACQDPTGAACTGAPKAVRLGKDSPLKLENGLWRVTVLRPETENPDNFLRTTDIALILAVENPEQFPRVKSLFTEATARALKEPDEQTRAKLAVYLEYLASQIQ